MTTEPSPTCERMTRPAAPADPSRTPAAGRGGALAGEDREQTWEPLLQIVLAHGDVALGSGGA
jgi:hypothetical protein